MAESAKEPPGDEIHESITLYTASLVKPCLNSSSANSAEPSGAEIPLSPTFSVSSCSTLSTLSDFDKDIDVSLEMQPLALSPEVKPEAIESRPGVPDNTENGIKGISSSKDINPTKNLLRKSRTRGVDVCADPDTVEAVRVAKAIDAAETKKFGTSELRQLRSRSKSIGESKLILTPSKRNTGISAKEGTSHFTPGIDNSRIEASPLKTAHENKDSRVHVDQSDHALSLETPAPRKKIIRKGKRGKGWVWARVESEEDRESKAPKLTATEEPVKRHQSLPPRLPSVETPSNSGKKPVRWSRALSEGADKPWNPTPLVPTVIKKTSILSETPVTLGRLRPRKGLNTNRYKFPDYTPTPIVPRKRRIANEIKAGATTSLSQARPLADITNKRRIEPEGEKLAKLQDGRDGSENSISKRKKPNGTKGARSNWNQDSSSSITGADNPEPVDGASMTPETCCSCSEKHLPCDKRLPCDSCVKEGFQCTREGLVPEDQIPATKIDPNRVENKPRKRARSAAKPLNQDLQLESEIDDPAAVVPKSKRVRVKKDTPNKPQAENIAKKETSIVSNDPQADKPPGIWRPSVWCESRQELCESLTYYRSYQGGVYGHDGLVMGSLLDGFPSPRDYIDGKVIISHTGGKSGTDEDGNRRLLASQTKDDNTIKYLLKNMSDRSPMVFIIGQKCGNSPSKIPHTYCVMDWFKVTVGWAEKDFPTGHARWKFRFEKLNTTTDGWWASHISFESEHPEEMVVATCCTCKTNSPHVYEEGWMCLNQNCLQWWQINGKDAPAELTYTHNIINCRTPWPLESSTPPTGLAPILDESRDIYYNGEDTSRIYWKGMCCPKCGRLNCRELWAGWRCISCGYTNNPPRTIFSAAALANPHRPIFTGPAVPENKCHPDIVYQRFVVGGALTVMQYEFGNCGTVTHILANKQTNSRPKGADWLLDNYQSVDMPFRRFTMVNHKSKGRLLSQQFTFNCGAPYKFLTKVETTPFENSPPVVTGSLELITELVRLVYPDAEFNEILSVGYFEGQKMDFHDDGEAGLGETVASISLGAPARMKFRLKKRYIKDTYLWTTKPPALLQNDNSNMDDEDLEDDEGEESVDVQQKPAPRVPKDNARVKLDLCLNHGDIMIMSGSGIQRYWEHSVIPLGKFRIAATARFIYPTHAGVVEQNLRDMNAANTVKTDADPVPLLQQPHGIIQEIPESVGDADEQNRAQGFPKFPTANIFHPIDIPVQMADISPFIKPEMEESSI